ncbi:hypothetical protein HJC23_013000 [Cyclotella cryptica]|uniref:PPM-type phosphatase domain-containing protein n=1 Tax=Cyclotella cryptica TaxID=29204 RepID=A0ABD3QNH2_9STRA
MNRSDIDLPDSPEEELAHSFRKRRLTYSRHHIQDSAKVVAELLGELDDDSVDNEDADDIVLNREEPNAATGGEKRRRPSDDNNAGHLPAKRVKQTPATTKLTPKRILHAGEIAKKTSPSSSHNYRLAPRSAKHFRSKWRQRFSFCSSTPDHVLPFPRHVVGTYSCHGMEPVYDSDYENDDDDSSDDDLADAHQRETQQTTAKINQDRGGIAYPYANSQHCALFAVYDGHGEGGEMVSQYALGEVQRLLEEKLLLLLERNSAMSSKTSTLGMIEEDGEVHKSESQCANEEFVVRNEQTLIEKAFIETFTNVDRGLLQESDIEPMYSGTTACVALLRHDKLYISNAGDSRAILARRRPSHSNEQSDMNHETSQASLEKTSSVPSLIAIPLSIDQNPDSPGEKERIISAGGYVSPSPEPGLSARVWLDPEHTQIGLAMARSIGDHAVKKVGVIAEPVVTIHEVGEDDEFVILATDGVWEFMENEDAIKIVSEHLLEDNSEGGKKCATTACEALIRVAMEKWHEYEGDYRDDITAIVISLKDLWRCH